MKILDVVDKISDLYRKERERIRTMGNEADAICHELRIAQERDWADITVARRNELHSRLTNLEHQIELCTKRAEGISEVREMFLNIYGNDGDV
jgi:hypothetical protein